MNEDNKIQIDIQDDGYYIFLTIELAKQYNDSIFEEDDCYDEIWEIGKNIYGVFETSEYNDPNKNTYDCICNFLDNYKIENNKTLN